MFSNKKTVKFHTTQQNPLTLSRKGAFQNRELTMTYSHMAGATLPLALRCFTSEFGKGSGGAIVLLSSAKGLDMSLLFYLLTKYHYPN